MVDPFTGSAVSTGYSSSGGEITDATKALTSHGWVRYSDGYVEGQSDAIKKHWPIISELAESDVIRWGMDAQTYFDIVDEDGRKVRSFKVPLGLLLKHQPPAGVFREPSIVIPSEAPLAPQESIEGRMPSGRPIRFGDRRVRRYRRRR